MWPTVGGFRPACKEVAIIMNHQHRQARFSVQSRNPFVRVLAALALLLILGLSLVVGAIAFFLFLGLAVIGAAVMAVRIWLLRRRVGDTPTATGPDRGRTIEGEVIERRDKTSDKKKD